MATSLKRKMNRFINRAQSTEGSNLVFITTMSCGHKRRLARRPVERLACVECNKTRDVIKVVPYRRTR